MHISKKLVVGGTAACALLVGIGFMVEKNQRSTDAIVQIDDTQTSHLNTARWRLSLSQFHPSLPETQTEPGTDARAAPLALAREYSEGRYNIFFDEQQFIEDLLARGEIVDQLQAELLSTEKLETLPEDTHYLTDQPPEVIDRINALDLLLAMATTDARAQRALTELALARIDGALPDHVQRVIMAEKYEMLESMATSDWETASRIHAELGESMQEILEPALHAGLRATGLTDEEAQHYLHSQI